MISLIELADPYRPNLNQPSLYIVLINTVLEVTALNFTLGTASKQMKPM